MLEVKRPGETLTPLQLYHSRLIEQAGGKWYRVESVDDVKNVLKGME